MRSQGYWRENNNRDTIGEIFRLPHNVIHMSLKAGLFTSAEESEKQIDSHRGLATNIMPNITVQFARVSDSI